MKQEDIASPEMEHEAILEEFRGKLDEYTRTAVCGRQFVLVEKLQDWLRSPVKDVNHVGVSQAERLLRVAYSNGQFSPVTRDVFRSGAGCCLLVFSILQIIGSGSAINVFCRGRKVDHSLPLPRDTLQEVFRAAGIHDQELPNKFFDQQHRFTPARFDLYGGHDWSEDTVIPIYQRNPIKKGGTAEIYQIDVPEEFVGLNLRDVCAGSRFNAGSDESPDWVSCLLPCLSQASYPCTRVHDPLFSFAHALINGSRDINLLSKPSNIPTRSCTKTR